MTNYGTVEERVERGLRLLDDHFKGTDWRSGVDLYELRVDLPCHCVIGQLFGGYGVGTGRLKLLTEADEIGNGFEALERGHDEDYRALTAEWRRRLAEPV